MKTRIVKRNESGKKLNGLLVLAVAVSFVVSPVPVWAGNDNRSINPGGTAIAAKPVVQQRALAQSHPVPIAVGVVQFAANAQNISVHRYSVNTNGVIRGFNPNNMKASISIRDRTNSQIAGKSVTPSRDADGTWSVDTSFIFGENKIRYVHTATLQIFRRIGTAWSIVARQTVRVNNPY